MPRYVQFGSADVNLVAAPGTPAPSVVVKSDVVPVFDGYDNDGNFNFTVPAYDVTTYNVLSAIHVSLYEKPDVPPTDPTAIIAAPMHYSEPTPAVVAQSITVDATAAFLGDYTAVFVAEFAE